EGDRRFRGFPSRAPSERVVGLPWRFSSYTILFEGCRRKRRFSCAYSYACELQYLHLASVPICQSQKTKEGIRGRRGLCFRSSLRRLDRILSRNSPSRFSIRWILRTV